MIHASRLAILAVSAVGFAGLGGCSGVKDLVDGDSAKHDAPLQPHDPNDVVKQTNNGSEPDAATAERPASTALSARTTLLEENEHLRDMLAKALAERRDSEQRFADSDLRVRELEAEVAKLRDSVAQLSEQIDTQTGQLEELQKVKAKLEKDRSTLAEMYALEKRQRLTYEKEALEREIRERTLSKDG